MSNRRSFLKMSVASLALSACTISTVGCDTSWITTAEKDVPVIQAVLDSVLAIAADATGNAILSPAAQVILNTAIKAGEAGLVVLGTLFADYKASSSAPVLAKIVSALEDVQTNLSSVLSIADIKDAALKTSIATGISLAISVLSTIEALLPNTKISSAAIGQKLTLLTPDQIKKQYNVVIVSRGYPQHIVR